MKLLTAAALALFVATPAFASPSAFTVNFEKTWDFSNGDVRNYYNGGAAADGSTGGPNLGVSFVNVSGLSNDALGPYYSGAPSPLGVAYAHDSAFINVAGGVGQMLSFYYSSPTKVLGAIKAYSGLNGTGFLVGTIDLTANDSGAYGTWTLANLLIAGYAQSFDLTAAAVESVVAFDNISARAVPEPGTVLLMLAGGAIAMRRRKARRN